MNLNEKLNLVEKVLTRYPEATVDILVSGAGSEKPTRTFANDISSMLGVQPEDVQNGGCEWIRVDARDFRTSFFYDRNEKETMEKLREELKELDSRKKSIQHKLSGYMIEDVSLTIEEH